MTLTLHLHPLRTRTEQHQADATEAIVGNTEWLLATTGRDVPGRVAACVAVLETTATSRTAAQTHGPDMRDAWAAYLDQLAQQQTIARLLRWQAWVRDERRCA